MIADDVVYASGGGRMLDGSENDGVVEAVPYRRPAAPLPSEPVTTLTTRVAQPVLIDIAPQRAPAPTTPPAAGGGGVTYNAPPPPDSASPPSSVPPSTTTARPVARPTTPAAPAAVREAPGEIVTTDAKRTRAVIAWLLVAAVAVIVLSGDKGGPEVWK